MKKPIDMRKLALIRKVEASRNKFTISSKVKKSYQFGKPAPITLAKVGK